MPPIQQAGKNPTCNREHLRTSTSNTMASHTPFRADAHGSDASFERPCERVPHKSTSRGGAPGSVENTTATGRWRHERGGAQVDKGLQILVEDAITSTLCLREGVVFRLNLPFFSSGRELFFNFRNISSLDPFSRSERARERERGRERGRKRERGHKKKRTSSKRSQQVCVHACHLRTSR